MKCTRCNDTQIMWGEHGKEDCVRCAYISVPLPKANEAEVVTEVFNVSRLPTKLKLVSND